MSRIAILAGQLECPLCGDGEQLHQIDDHEFGCDRCKNLFYITNPGSNIFPESHPGTPQKDKDGNPLFPEQIL